MCRKRLIDQCPNLELRLEHLELAGQRDIGIERNTQLLPEQKPGLPHVALRLDHRDFGSTQVDFGLPSFGTGRGPRLHARVHDPEVLLGAIHLTLCDVDLVHEA